MTLKDTGGQYPMQSEYSSLIAHFLEEVKLSLGDGAEVELGIIAFCLSIPENGNLKDVREFVKKYPEYGDASSIAATIVSLLDNTHCLELLRLLFTLSEISPFRILVIGNSGTGKTRLCGTLPCAESLVYIDVEGRGVNPRLPKTPYLKLLGGVDGTVDPYSTILRSLLYYRLLDSSIQGFFLDSLTALEDIVDSFAILYSQEHLRGKDKVDQLGSQSTLNFWNVYGKVVKQTLAIFARLPCHQVVLARPTNIPESLLNKSPSLKQWKTVLFKGNQALDNVAAHFDNVCAIVVEPTKNVIPLQQDNPYLTLSEEESALDKKHFLQFAQSKLIKGVFKVSDSITLGLEGNKPIRFTDADLSIIYEYHQLAKTKGATTYAVHISNLLTPQLGLFKQKLTDKLNNNHTKND